jgi:HEAT repeat protein
MDSTEIEALFAQALLGDYEGEEAWAAVSALRRDGSREIFERAAEWCHSDNPLKRARAAAILCQLRRRDESLDTDWSPDWMYRDESYPLVTGMLEKEQDPVVLDSAISALGHLADPKAVSLILGYQDHPNKDVRFAVAFALGCFPNDAQSVLALMKLTTDSDSDVRDWAVFGLGVLGDADSHEIREALLRCLNDANEDVREEAAVGLGKRQDQRLIPKLRTMLDEPELKVRVAEAAAALLGLDQDPPEWAAAEYKAALRSKFSLQD